MTKKLIALNSGELTDLEKDLAIALTLHTTGMDRHSCTDPKLMNQLLNTLHLDTFSTSFPPLQQVLTDLKTQPQDLTRFLTMVKRGVRENDPLVDFLVKGNCQHFFSEHDDFKVGVHMAFLLEQLTLAAANNNAMLAELFQHMMTVRQLYIKQPRSPVRTFFKLWREANFFTAAKTVSVDPAIKMYILSRAREGRPFSRAELRHLLRTGEINFLEKSQLNPNRSRKVNNGAFQINILEAGMTEYSRGYRDNAMAAYALMKVAGHTEVHRSEQGRVLPRHYSADPDSRLDSHLDDTNVYSYNEFSQAFVNLYEAWNMCFVLSDQKDVHLVMPKLLIPSQIDAQPHQYLFSRALTLWNVVNTVILKKLAHQPQSDRPAQRREIATAWGKVNRNHALKLVQKELGMTPAAFEAEFDAYFARRRRHFLSLLRRLF